MKDAHHRGSEERVGSSSDVDGCATASGGKYVALINTRPVVAFTYPEFFRSIPGAPRSGQDTRSPPRVPDCVGSQSWVYSRIMTKRRR